MHFLLGPLAINSGISASELVILKVEGISGSEQWQISLLVKSSHVLFCVFLSPQYFETDDPEFYKSKVCFILNNDMSEMELVFAEEKYNKSGQLDKVRKRTRCSLFVLFFEHPKRG